MRQLRRRLGALLDRAERWAAYRWFDRTGRVPESKPGRGRTAVRPEARVVMVTESLMPRPSLEGIEHDCRRAMAEIARMKPRGFDGEREKRRAIQVLDEQLDLYNLAREAAAGTDWAREEADV